VGGGVGGVGAGEFGGDVEGGAGEAGLFDCEPELGFVAVHWWEVSSEAVAGCGNGNEMGYGRTLSAIEVSVARTDGCQDRGDQLVVYVRGIGGACDLRAGGACAVAQLGELAVRKPMAEEEEEEEEEREEEGKTDHGDDIAVVEGEGWDCGGLCGGVGGGGALVGGARGSGF